MSLQDKAETSWPQYRGSLMGMTEPAKRAVEELAGAYILNDEDDGDSEDDEDMYDLNDFIEEARLERELEIKAQQKMFRLASTEYSDDGYGEEDITGMDDADVEEVWVGEGHVDLSHRGKAVPRDGVHGATGMTSPKDSTGSYSEPSKIAERPKALVSDEEEVWDGEGFIHEGNQRGNFSKHKKIEGPSSVVPPKSFGPSHSEKNKRVGPPPSPASLLKENPAFGGGGLCAASDSSGMGVDALKRFFEFVSSRSWCGNTRTSPFKSREVNMLDQIFECIKSRSDTGNQSVSDLNHDRDLLELISEFVKLWIRPGMWSDSSLYPPPPWVGELKSYLDSKTMSEKLQDLCRQTNLNADQGESSDWIGPDTIIPCASSSLSSSLSSSTPSVIGGHGAFHHIRHQQFPAQSQALCQPGSQPVSEKFGSLSLSDLSHQNYQQQLQQPSSSTSSTQLLSAGGKVGNDMQKSTVASYPLTSVSENDQIFRCFVFFIKCKIRVGFLLFVYFCFFVFFLIFFITV